MDYTIATAKILKYLDLSQQIECQLLNRRFYENIVPRAIDTMNILNPKFFRFDAGHEFFFYKEILKKSST